MMRPFIKRKKRKNMIIKRKKRKKQIKKRKTIIFIEKGVYTLKNFYTCRYKFILVGINKV